MNFVASTASHCARLIAGLYDGRLAPTIVSTATDTQVRVEVYDSIAYVVFPGTASATDWKTDAKIRKEPWFDGASGRVHRGFKAATESVLSAIIKTLPAGHRITVAGHSLGGALAMLTAHALAREDKFAQLASPGTAEIGIEVYTFGQPRVGNWVFASDYNAALHDVTFRVVNAGDPVPKVPFVFGSYKHAGTEVYLPTPEADDPQEAIIEHPWWTSVREAGQTLQTMSQAGGARPDLTQLSLNFPNHSIASYIAKLEALQ